MAGYLLDTNIVSAAIREPRGLLSQRIARAGERNVFTSVIVAAELRFGALRRGSLRLRASLDAILGGMEIAPLETAAVEHYARLRMALERVGEPISANDMLIAAHALALDATLVTDNEREFGRIDGLAVENWLR
ncbi:MAG: type II toxin-antitoxin system VapC family toxin [Caulobacteraceae bacterium]